MAGQVFGFRWAEACGLPMFPFDAATMAIREGPLRVLDPIHHAPDAVLAAARLAATG